MPNYFGIRHLSPNGAFSLIKHLNEIKPKAVLIEAPCDFTEFIPNFTQKDVKPPFAILSFTTQKPIKTIVVPFAEYSPEYQAVMWCYNNDVQCKFIDLPSDIFMSLDALDFVEEDDDDDDTKDTEVELVTSSNINIYRLLEEKVGSHETFWEHSIEHQDNYFDAVTQYGELFREFDLKDSQELVENTLREAHMKMEIEATISSGIAHEDIVVIAGAYHIPALKNPDVKAMTSKEKAKIKAPKISTTLMPYSNFKLSKQAGYGAGNKAPNYFNMVWKALNSNNLNDVAFEYLTDIARNMRLAGHNASSAQVIDAVTLAKSLAKLNNRNYPTLADLQDASITCFGEGSLASVATARTLVEIGTTIGSLPKGASNTAIQQDFSTYIKELNLTKYLDIINQELSLDLRENIHVKTEKAAFNDLNRSFFLHKLRVLEIHFCSQILYSQDGASYREKWNLQWSTEAEIELIECSLFGDTIQKACVEKMKEQIIEKPQISTISCMIKECFLCGLPEALSEFLVLFQTHSIDSTDFIGFCHTIKNLMDIIIYGNIRRIDNEHLAENIEEILSNLYLKATLLVSQACECDDTQVKEVMQCFDILDKLITEIDFINQDLFLEILDDLADNLTINQFLSGYAVALLLEKGYYSPQDIETKINFHLSLTSDGRLTANWLEGLAMKNRYQLILNLNIWKEFDAYINTLDDEGFKRIILFLRRAFARFSSNEKDSIVDNLQEIWGIKFAKDLVNTTVNASDIQEMVESIDDFDFDDI